MIIKYTNFLENSIKLFKSQYLINKIVYNFSSPAVYNHLNLNTLSEKWNVQFNYVSNPMVQNQNKVRPNYGSRCFRIKLVQRTMLYVKGRPTYYIELNSMDTLKLAYWNYKYGKFHMVTSNSYKQQVLTIQKVNKKSINQNNTQEQLNKLSQTIIKNKQTINKSLMQQQKQLFKFTFYNDKQQQQKLKQFFMQPCELFFLQQTLKSGFSQISFRQSTKDYQIYKQQKQINNKTKIIQSPYLNNHQND